MRGGTCGGGALPLYWLAKKMRRTGRPARASAQKKSVPALDRRATQALDLFERAVKALSRKNFSRAADLLDQIIDDYPEQRDVVERAKAYRAACERSRERRPTRPKTFEDLLHHGIYHHNRGEYLEALKFLNQAAEIHPRNEHVLYCVAASAARAGDTATSLRALRAAVAASPANRTQARTDPDFDTLRDDPDFVALVSS